MSEYQTRLGAMTDAELAQERARVLRDVQFESSSRVLVRLNEKAH
jgi:hypothetical protein